jgi:hypothetical protein
MCEFVADQVLGISGLINLSNIVFLVAFSMRDVLKLRIFGHRRRGADLAILLFPGRKTVAAHFQGSGVHDRPRDPQPWR